MALCVQCDGKGFSINTCLHGFECNFCASVVVQCFTYLTFGFKQAAQIVYDPIHEFGGVLRVVLKKKDSGFFIG